MLLKRHDCDMEDEIQLQAQACKFPRLDNGTRNESNNKMGSSVRKQYPPPDEKEDGGELRRRNAAGSTTNHNFQSSTWHHHSSRIIRVSRASGGKDRHSKVMTSKGLRDRRVRLSVATAIQFYDLQDRLGYDQPSKAVEWLIKAASDAISELPSLSNTFPETPNQQQPSNTEKRPSDDQQNQSQNLSLSKSACSSNSETSKGSGLSLSRSEIRVKARERASKEKENESNIHHNVNHHNNHNHMSQSASFTELLTGGIGGSTVTVPATTTSPYSTVTPMDYFSSGLLVGHSSSRTHQSSPASASSSSGFSGQIQLGHSNSHCLQVSPFSGENENHSDHQMQHFPFMNEHLLPPHHVVTCSNSCSQPSGSDYNLNFTISSGLAGYNRGTLQSNSPSLLPHLQRFSTMDGSTTTSNNLPFFIGAAAAPPPTMDSHHHLQFSPVFDGRLQLCYGDGSGHSDQKGKGNKN